MILGEIKTDSNTSGNSYGMRNTHFKIPLKIAYQAYGAGKVWGYLSAAGFSPKCDRFALLQKAQNKSRLVKLKRALKTRK